MMLMRKKKSLLKCSFFVVLGGVSGVLFILVLGDQVPDVLISLLELHFVHALALVPMQECLALVHRAELGGEALEDALERGGVGHEGARGLVVHGRALDDGGLHVVGDPLDKVVVVLVLALRDYLVHLLGVHLATVNQGGGHVLAVVGLHIGEEVARGEALVGEFLHVHKLVPLVLLGCERGLR